MPYIANSIKSHFCFPEYQKFTGDLPLDPTGGLASQTPLASVVLILNMSLFIRHRARLASISGNAS